jgi:hypothetical protein
MDSESKELANARALLHKFDGQKNSPEGLALLEDGLALLADARDGDASGKEATVATNIAGSYARKIAAEVDRLLAENQEIHLEVWAHWRKVFEAFEAADFAVPQDAAEARSRLLAGETAKTLDYVSPSQREQLLARLKNSRD